MKTESGAAAHIPLGEFLTTEEPVWVWDASARRILWANQAGREFWGAASIDAIRAKRFSSRNKSVERLTALAAQPGGAKEWTETLTLSAASGRRPTKCYIQGLEVAGGRPGLIVKALGDANRRERAPADRGDETANAPAARGKRPAPEKSDRAAFDAIAKRLRRPEGQSRDRAQAFAGPASGTERGNLDQETLALNVRELCHEVRNPLQVILGFAERIIEIAPPGRRQDQLRAYAGDIVEGANLAMAILGDFSARMLHPDDEPPRAEPADLRAAIESCIRLILPLARASGIKVRRRVEGRLPALMMAEQALKQILLNLMMNAVRHNNSVRQIKLTARRRKDGTVRLTVADDGKGMNKKEIRAAMVGSSAPSQGRSGLGLPLVKRLVENVGGRIAMQSARGKGTTVEILFPSAG
jgi:signal transduction histidine kinase